MSCSWKIYILLFHIKYDLGLQRVAHGYTRFSFYKMLTGNAEISYQGLFSYKINIKKSTNFNQ